MRTIQVITIIATLFIGCKKAEDKQFDCDALKSSLLTEDVAATTKLLSGDLTEYSKQNLIQIANNINSRCGDLVASLDCFNCIYTQPPQSELSITVKTNDSTLVKVIDLSSTSGSQIKILRIYH